MIRWVLTFAFITGRVASLTGLGAWLHVVMLWTGAMALSFGAEQKEEWIAGQAVCGLRALAGLAAPVAPLALSCGVFCIIPELAQTHVHRVGDAIQSSHPLPPPSPFAFNLCQHWGLFK